MRPSCPPAMDVEPHLGALVSRAQRCASRQSMRRSTLLELSSMELHEIAHVHRYFVGKLAHSIRHAVITPLPGQLGHGREMLDEVFRKLRLPKAFAPRREWDVAISDGPAERLSWCCPRLASARDRGR